MDIKSAIREKIEKHKDYVIGISILLILICVFYIFYCLNVSNKYKQALNYYDKIINSQDIEDFKKSYNAFSELYEKHSDYKNVEQYYIYSSYRYYFKSALINTNPKESKDLFKKALDYKKYSIIENEQLINALINSCDIKILLAEANTKLKEYKYIEALDLYKKALNIDDSLHIKSILDEPGRKKALEDKKGLEKAVNKAIKHCQKEIKKLKAGYKEVLHKIDIEQDKIENRAYIKDKSQLDIILKNGVSLEFASLNNFKDVEPILAIYHVDEDFLYYNKAIINCDGEKFEIDIDDKDIVRKRVPEFIYLFGINAVKEHAVLFNSKYKNIIDIANKIAHSKHAYIRLKGTIKDFDREISTEEKNSLILMSNYYWYVNHPEYIK